MAEGQPPEPNVQLLVDPVEPVVNPPVVNPLVVNPPVVNPPDGNQNVNVAQPQGTGGSSLLVVMNFFVAYFSCLSYLSGSSHSMVERITESFWPDRGLLSKSFRKIVGLFRVAS